MLVNNVNGEAVGASMVRDSEFYIEIAMFVQAYTVIINNPNVFLNEVGEKNINENQEKITWKQLVKIMQKCDFGFEKVPTETELLVYYNYALEIGTIDSKNQKIATVGEIAEAQKHYYNFVDKAKDRAENEYLNQHKVYLSRESEMKNIDNELSKYKAYTVFAYIMMMFSVFVGLFGIFSFFVDNVIVSSIGKILPFIKAQYVGASILIILAFIMFYLFNKMHEKFHRKHFKLAKATETIFARGNESYIQEVILKKKLDVLTRELKTVQEQLNDSEKKYDVQENINRLKTTNKYYQKYAANEEVYEAVSNANTDDVMSLRVEDFAPVTLSKEQEENLRRVNKEAISLEGQFDEEAYNEKFEKSKFEKEEKEQQVEAEETQKQEEQTQALQDAQIQQNLQEQQKQEDLKAQEQDLLESIDYIKSILSLNDDEYQQNK